MIHCGPAVYRTHFGPAICRVAIAALSSVTLLVSAPPAGAQQSRDSSSTHAALGTVQEDLAALVRWPEVPETFAGYGAPGECAQVATWYERQFWRARREDTVFVPREGLSLQPATMA